MIIKILNLLILVLSLTACESNQLKVSDNLTAEQRKAWRIALNFPKNCKNGKYEFDDKDAPLVYFLHGKNNQTLVYNVCERYAYQDLVNVYILDKKKQNPRLITFPIIELDESSVRYTDKNGKELKTPIAKYNIKISSLLLQRGVEILHDGKIKVTRHFSGAGNCGSLTTYDISTSNTKIIQLLAQFNCNKTQKDMGKWPRYKIVCPKQEQTSDCKVQKL